MRKKFEINETKIKGGRQSGRKIVTHNSKSDLPLKSCNMNSLIRYTRSLINLSIELLMAKKKPALIINLVFLHELSTYL